MPTTGSAKRAAARLRPAYHWPETRPQEGQEPRRRYGETALRRTGVETVGQVGRSLASHATARPPSSRRPV